MSKPRRCGVWLIAEIADCWVTCRSSTPPSLHGHAYQREMAQTAWVWSARSRAALMSGETDRCFTVTCGKTTDQPLLLCVIWSIGCICVQKKKDQNQIERSRVRSDLQILPDILSGDFALQFLQSVCSA